MRRVCLLSLLSILLSCSNPNNNTLQIGVIAGPEAALAKTAGKIAEKNGLYVKIVEFTDYNLPNEALENGAIDANIYQHAPYLKTMNKTHGYHLKALAKTFVFPTALYSLRHHTLSQLKEGALIAIPNDPSNEARALLLLQKAGLITLKNSEKPNVSQILDNPKHLKIRQLDAAQLPRILEDVDAAVINTTFAIPAGLYPNTQGLFVEDKDSPYANLIVIKEGTPKLEALKKFVHAFQSKAVMDQAIILFNNAAIPAWSNQ